MPDAIHIRYVAMLVLVTQCTYSSACKKEKARNPIQGQYNDSLQRFDEDGTNTSDCEDQSCCTAERAIVKQ
jgi:hypothetical protein